MHRFIFRLRLTLMLLAVAVSAGCTNQAMNSVIASWQNRPVSEVIAEWGQPSEELRVSGKHLFIWSTYDGMLSPPHSPSPSSRRDSNNCVRLLGVDRTGKVISGAWEGSSCPGLFSGWGR